MAKKKQESDLIVKLSRPYNFEGTEYTEIDLKGIEQLTTDDLAEAQSEMEGTGSLVPELDYGYIMIVAAKATSLPIEFFKGLPAKDGITVKGEITSYFFTD